MESKLDFHKLSQSVYFSVILSITTICTGFLFLLIYFPTFFFSVDYFRLSIIGIGISFPLVVANTVLLRNVNPDVKLEDNIIIAATATLLIFSIAIVSGYFVDTFFSIESHKRFGVWSIISFEIGFYFGILKRKRDLKKNIK